MDTLGAKSTIQQISFNCLKCLNSVMVFLSVFEAPTNCQLNLNARTEVSSAFYVIASSWFVFVRFSALVFSTSSALSSCTPKKGSRKEWMQKKTSSKKREWKRNAVQFDTVKA